MRMFKASFYLDYRQLDKLRELSKRTKIPQGQFVREGLTYILKKYSFLLTLTPWSTEEALNKILGAESEERIREWMEETGLSRFEVEQRLLRMIIDPPKILRVDEKGEVEEWRPKRRRLWRREMIESAMKGVRESDERIRRGKRK